MDDASLSHEDWAQLDSLAQTIVYESAQVRSLLPRGPDALGAYVVQTPTISDTPLGLDTSTSVPPVTIRCDFVVRAEQVGDVDVHKRLVRAAARRVAMAEDLVLTFGKKLGSRTPPGVTLKRGGVKGIIEGVIAERDLPSAVRSALAHVQTKGHPSPYALLLMPELWIEAANISQVRTGIEVLRMALGPDARAAPLPQPWTSGRGPEELERCGVVLTRVGAFELIQVAEPSVVRVKDDDGDLVLRVEERLLLQVIDDTGAFAFKLKKPKQEKK